MTHKCVPYVNSTQGGECGTLSEDGFYRCASEEDFLCNSGKCFRYIRVGSGEKCQYYNSTSFTTTICGTGLECDLSGICLLVKYSAVGGFCGVNSTEIYKCENSLCFNAKCIPFVESQIGGKCSITDSEGRFTCVSSANIYCFNNTCMARGKLGESCEHKYDSCEASLACRSINGSSRTCQNLAQKYESCYLSAECSPGLTCAYEKCTNLNGKPVGEPCSFNVECDSGLCSNSTCSLNYTTTSCSSDTSCSNYESKCSCGSGRASSSNSFGTCASLKRCKVYKSILDICLYNNGRGGELTTVFDRQSSIHKACVKEFSQYYSCLRIGLTNAGNVPHTFNFES